uniref:Calpain catalytic domain-containing protein n=1 Tax=Chromera velia CCMP2878 TaxID=1169474 RepID=A0A0G4HD61_9ALVE|eukprot:Cvel_26391.t1-p1 / transcript=Cvel_26391.t1 / gene=Cvel_26391 / organism=Chromera_velia_CCMP2878 / gene_product=Androglobin, putative / transcript_product=Androglobin, putative / location=Cvel_scaffold3131:2103-5670(+) / protein_length=378 / sequence_SO=supercontig / SO=protein_coding / is_pseudo=false
MLFITIRTCACCCSFQSTPFAPDDAQKFVDTFFDRRALPRSLAGHCIGWKRAPIAASKDAEYEPEPQAAAEEAEDPKKAGGKGGGKDAKPPAKGGDKGGGKEREMEDVFVNHMDGPKFVVKKLHWYTRDALAPGQLVLDGTAPEWVQWLTSQFVLIAENAPFFSQGTFLWENIHPQDKNGWPLFNPQGLYVVRLFVQGAWRSIRIDDVVPVASDTQALSPRCADDDILWPLLLTKALLTAFQREVGLGVQDIPVVEALTGWRPQKIPLSWPVLSALAYRSPLASIELKSDPEALHGHGHTPLVGATGIPGSGPMSRQVSLDGSVGQAEIPQREADGGFQSAPPSHKGKPYKPNDAGRNTQLRTDQTDGCADAPGRASV